MNTIPLTFNENQISRTILGGSENPGEHLNISVILINKIGSQFKTKVFDELLKCNFASIVSIEPDTGNYNIEEVSRRYPTIKFIIPHEEVTDGEMINMGMAEINSDFVFVLKDSLYIPQGIILPHLAENLTKTRCLCIVPRLVDMKKNGLPIQKSPSAKKSHFILESSAFVTDGINTVYPFDYVGIYNREKFIQLGGFDYTIKSPYWQLLDFGIRAHRFGESIRITTVLQLSYSDEHPIEDSTPGLDSLRFYLKNENPKFHVDHAFVSPLSFWRFFFGSSCGVLEARRQFIDAKNWVFVNKYKFKKDLKTLIEEWK